MLIRKLPKVCESQNDCNLAKQYKLKNSLIIHEENTKEMNV